MPEKQTDVEQEPLTQDQQIRLVLRQRVEHNFTYHAPRPGQPEKYQRLRDEAKVLAHTIVELCPNSREQAVAITHLETAVMWANAAIARLDTEPSKKEDGDVG